MDMKPSLLKTVPAVLVLALLLSDTPFCRADDNLNKFNTICNWIEINFPQYFSPPSETFEVSGYLIRHYENTDTYVGTINGGFYGLGGIFGDEVLYVGTMDYLLGLITPQETVTFIRTFGGSDFDFAECVRQTSDGGYIIVGHTASFGAANRNVYLVKTDSSGNQIWTRTFGGTDDDYGVSVQQTSDGGYIIAGSTKSFGAESFDIYLIKTDGSGNQLFAKTFGGDDKDVARSVQQTSDGGYIIAGYTKSFGAGDADVYLIKTDSYGNQIWAKTFGGTSADQGYSVQQTSDGGYIIAGYTKSFGAGLFDVYLIKTDSSGNEAWTKTFGGTNHDFSKSVQQTNDGGYIIAGYTKSFGAGLFDVYLVKTDSSGNQTWTKTFGGASSEKGHSVRQTNDGGYIIAGRTSSFGSGLFDVYLIKTDSSGNEAWHKTFGGTDYDDSKSVWQTTDGGFIIAGHTMSFGSGSWDVYLIKTDSSGNVN